MPTLALSVAYNGAPFCGYAKQPDQATVQGEIEDALAIVFKRKIDTVCAGRTDAGVHALGQVVSFEVSQEELNQKTNASLLRSLNALTSDDVTVSAVTVCNDGFSARFDAVLREYRYFLVVGKTPPIFMKDKSWYVADDLDIAAMYEASRCLIGEHDFKSFCMAASSVDKTTMRNISEISFSEEKMFGEEVVVIKVCGNAFLHSMVRTIVGTLVMVGRHKREISWVKEALDALNRSAAGECAPAAGLFLWKVTYEHELFDKPADISEKPRMSIPSTFQLMYTGAGGKLCFFKDAEGHITAIRSDRLYPHE
ncbi:MAG: tRNA pseudouridine(38-40) synthase TruA [Eggerthellaceae bacterium]|nr:tRNA pseudouridine(38-40) synthase TruA [Eggerthellaceae bacterium]